jgi:hypothetical protein
MALAVAALVSGFGLVSTGTAGAAGVTTHTWMDLDAIGRVTSPQLKALLQANRTYVRAGAHFPDSGYALSNQYGEEAHWQRFHNALAAQILSHGECTDLAAIHGPCAPLIALLMGAIGHGMGDEVWDWLFEPTVADNGEWYTPDDLGGYATESGAELQMDLVAIADHGQPTNDIVEWPNRPDLLAAFNAAGFTAVDTDALSLGFAAMNIAHQGEAAWAPTHIAEIHQVMPWASHNMVTAPGGIHFAAVAIAGAWDSMWGYLLGERPQTKVSITYPADGQRRIPAIGWDREHDPGSSRGRGGARTRIMAALTYARPYDHPGADPFPVDVHLPAGSMTLVERESGNPVPLRPGYPKSVPYGADAGEHVVDIQPNGDLTPCTWYRAAVNEGVIDADGNPVAPLSWDFRTGTDADGHRCADDPYTADENFARKTTTDLLGRDATEAELQDVGHTFERGRSRKTHTALQLASAEERAKLVTETFEHYLGRGPDPSGLAYWSTKLLTISLPELAARLAGSAEVYRKAGGTNAGYVAALYPLVHGRPVDPSGAAYWKARLDAGMSRIVLARSLLLSHESAQRTVIQAYQRFLGRAPDPSGKAHWTAVLQHGADPRDLWQSIILTAEYDRRAQEA